MNLTVVVVGCIITLIGTIVTGVGWNWDKLQRHSNSQPVEDQKVRQSMDDIHIEQTGNGNLAVGKVDSLNILTDKESLGIREPDGLYQNGKKVGKVINFSVSKSLKTFSISQIEFDQPLRDQSAIWRPYEFQDYIIQIKNINSLVTMMPPGAQGVSGIILGKGVSKKK